MRRIKNNTNENKQAVVSMHEVRNTCFFKCKIFHDVKHKLRQALRVDIVFNIQHVF